MAILFALSWLPLSAEVGGANHDLPFNQQFLPYWLPVFLLGIVTFQRKVGLLSNNEYLILLSVTSAGVLWRTERPSVLLAALTTAVVIAYVPKTNAPLRWLGRISYSLYLVHVPIGGLVLSIARRTSLPQWLSGIIAVSLSLIAAWLFYQWVELPAQRWANRIQYNHSLRYQTEPRFSKV